MADGQARDPITGQFLPKTETEPAPVHATTARNIREIHGALSEAIKIPTLSTFVARPGFEGHDMVTTATGTSGSYFWHWERLNDRNPIFAAVNATFRDLIMAYGYRFEGDDRFRDRWEAWVSKSNFIGILGDLVYAACFSGNGIAAMKRLTSNLLDLKIDPLPVRGIWPQLNADQTEFDRYVFRYPNSKSPFDPEFGKSWTIPVEDIIHIKFNRVPGVFFGRAIGYQALNLLVEIIELSHVFGVMAKRSTHGLLHFKINLEGLSQERIKDPAAGVEALSPAEQKVRAVMDIGDQRVQYDRETDIVRISNDLYTDQTVEIVPVTLQNDMEGIERAISTLLRVVDRALQIPKNVLGEGEGSNRATAREQNRMLAARLKAMHAVICEEIADKVFPELGIPDTCSLTIDQEILNEDGELINQSRLAVAALFRERIVTLSEAREEIEGDWHADLEDLEDVTPPPPVPPEPDEVEETDDTESEDTEPEA